MVAIQNFIWDDNNIYHIAQHNVEPEEVEEVFASSYYLRRLWGNRHIAYGRSQSGRYLFVAFDYEKQSIVVATARNMTDREKRLYKRRVIK